MFVDTVDTGVCGSMRCENSAFGLSTLSIQIWVEHFKYWMKSLLSESGFKLKPLRIRPQLIRIVDTVDTRLIWVEHFEYRMKSLLSESGFELKPLWIRPQLIRIVDTVDTRLIWVEHFEYRMNLIVDTVDTLIRIVEAFCLPYFSLSDLSRTFQIPDEPDCRTRLSTLYTHPVLMLYYWRQSKESKHQC